MNFEKPPKKEPEEETKKRPEIKFIGRRYTEKEKIGGQKALEQWNERGKEKIEGELEKSEEEIKMIDTINSLLTKELESLGVGEYTPLLLEQVHILDDTTFKKRFPGSRAFGYFRSTDNAIFLNRDSHTTKAEKLESLLHESIHQSSTQKFFATPPTEGGYDISDARTGYRLRSEWKGGKDVHKFRGFNELMTDYTAYKILSKNSDTIEESFGITHKEINGPIYSYMEYEPILVAIVNKISKEKNMSRQNVFSDLEAGMFKNTILNLKVIEKTFGKGSLRVLSYLQSLRNSDNNEKLIPVIQEFFEESDEQEREKKGVLIKDLYEQLQKEEAETREEKSTKD